MSTNFTEAQQQEQMNICGPGWHLCSTVSMSHKQMELMADLIGLGLDDHFHQFSAVEVFEMYKMIDMLRETIQEDILHNGDGSVLKETLTHGLCL